MVWQGAAAVCLDREGRLLMVLQGTPEEEKKWAIPSGGKEARETFEACCVREFKEETGYEAEVIRPLLVKCDGAVEVRYFKERRGERPWAFIPGGPAVSAFPVRGSETL